VRVLLDHNLPHKLRTNLGTPGKHEFVTASYMRWGDLKNGELLRAAEESGIEVFVTGDRSLVYEQNLTGRRLAIVALSTNNLSALRPGSRCKGLSLTASPFEIAAGHGTA
jgi:predicted nuclease of predicted toxin-antitoxin system